MRARTLGWMLVGIAGLLAFGGDVRAAGIEGPPPSLARYYPPKAPDRVYVREMLELGRLLGTAAIDAEEGSLHLGDSVRALGEQYGKLKGMVPEWEKRWPAVDFAALAAEAGTADGRRRVKEALEGIEGTCTSCHAAAMFPVQAAYDWPRFAAVSVEDEQGRRVPFHNTMVDLSNEMAVIPELAARQDWPALRTHADALRSRFDRLERSCDNCHAEAREYFVDKNIKARVLEIGGLARSEEADVARYRGALDMITSRSCIPCHQIHMPAAFFQQELDAQ